MFHQRSPASFLHVRQSCVSQSSSCRTRNLRDQSGRNSRSLRASRFTLLMSPLFLLSTSVSAFACLVAVNLRPIPLVNEVYRRDSTRRHSDVGITSDSSYSISVLGNLPTPPLLTNSTDWTAAMKTLLPLDLGPPTIRVIVSRRLSWCQPARQIVCTTSFPTRIAVRIVFLDEFSTSVLLW